MMRFIFNDLSDEFALVQQQESARFITGGKQSRNENTM